MGAIMKFGGAAMLLQVLNALEAFLATYNRVTSNSGGIVTAFKNFLSEKLNIDLDEDVIGIFLDEYVDANYDKINILRNLIYMNMGMTIINPLEDYVMWVFKNGRKSAFNFIKKMKLPSWANKSVGASKFLKILKGDVNTQVKRYSDYSYQGTMAGANIAQTFNTGHLGNIEKIMRRQGLTASGSAGSQAVLREILNLEKTVN